MRFTTVVVCIAFLWTFAFVATDSSVVSCYGDCANATEMCASIIPVTSGVLTATACSINSGGSGATTAAPGFSGKLTCLCSPNLTAASSLIGVSAVVDWSPSLEMCAITQPLDNSPQGHVCSATTGICPTAIDCQNTSSLFSEVCSTREFVCSTPSGGAGGTASTSLNASLLLQCHTCDGGFYRILVDEGTGRCNKTYTASTSSCRPETTCHNHGCCAPALVPGDATSGPVGSCNCYADRVRGYWDEAYGCSVCAALYTSPDSSSAGGPCTQPKSQLVVLLQSLGTSSATMILPNLLIVVMFVLFGIARRVWASDDVFDLTLARRVGLPWNRELRHDPSGPRWIVRPRLFAERSRAETAIAAAGESYSSVGSLMPAHRGDIVHESPSSSHQHHPHPASLSNGVVMSSSASGVFDGGFHGAHESASVLTAFRAKEIPRRPGASIGIVNRMERYLQEERRARGGTAR